MDSISCCLSIIFLSVTKIVCELSGCIVDLPLYALLFLIISPWPMRSYHFFIGNSSKLRQFQLIGLKMIVYAHKIIGISFNISYDRPMGVILT